jgi:hypothetical protein
MCPKHGLKTTKKQYILPHSTLAAYKPNMAQIAGMAYRELHREGEEIFLKNPSSRFCLHRDSVFVPICFFFQLTTGFQIGD